MFASFHYSQFTPEMLLARKAESGLSISLVIPTLNEEATIGRIVSAAQRELAEKHGLLDEIVVIDTDSHDQTAAIASSAGARVLSISEAGPEVGLQGKGTSLWKSQFVTKGDIVVCIDADIVDFDTRFVSGLIGPLLHSPEVVFAKAFYRRPLVLDNQWFDNYGGRVTEILVRPMLSMFLPELARMHQPLAGEFAVRRSVMSSVPFSSGYGVDIGLLVDIYERFGAEHIAEVDMEQRHHRNRSVGELGQISFGVLQSLLSRLERAGTISINGKACDSMVTLSGDGFDHTAIREVDLCPRSTYKDSRGADL